MAYQITPEDMAREAEIQACAGLMEAAVAHAERGGCYFVCMAEADRYRRRRDEMVKARPAPYVRMLEEQRGLV